MKTDWDNQISSTSNPVLQVGLVGHKPGSIIFSTNTKFNRPDTDIPAMKINIRLVLEMIRTAFNDLIDSAFFASEIVNENQPGMGTLRFFSSLASGADQWGAEVAFNLGFEIYSILPFRRDEYLKDFMTKSDAITFQKLLSNSASVYEIGQFFNPSESRNENHTLFYEAAGREILKQADLLIAVWDGQKARGRGGTGQMVKEAIINKIPVIWIPWAAPYKWQLLKQVAPQGRDSVILESQSVLMMELIKKIFRSDRSIKKTNRIDNGNKYS